MKLTFEDLGLPSPESAQTALKRRLDRRPAQLRVRTGHDYVKATWWAQTKGGNMYWRCTVPARQLPGRVLQLRFDDLREVDGEITMPRQHGPTAVWSYPGNATRGILMSAQQQSGVRVLIEVDDNYLLMPTKVPGGHTEWQNHLDRTSSDKHSRRAHARLAGFVDGIIVTTETLAEAYRPVNQNVYVCRNSVDPDDWEEPDRPDDGVFRIGYAASHSHYFDARDVVRALSWAAQQPGVEVVMLGLDPKWGFQYRQVPWTEDLAEYRRSLQQLDVGLCPLRSDPWADCKSDIKLMELAMAGACAVVSDTPPYSEWVDTDTCLTARSPKDFYRQVKWLVDNRDAAPGLAARAKERILRERLIEHEIVRWREAIAG